MAIQSVKSLAVDGKRVFVRCDLNVPLTPAGGVADDTRIRESLPTLRWLVDRGARVVIGSHLGRPKGAGEARRASPDEGRSPLFDPKYSLEPVGARLAELLKQEVVLTDEPVGDGARKVVHDLKAGEVALLENLRFHPGEEANDDGLARQLASYADCYVNDAFGTAHRAHASTAGMVKYVAQKAAGLLMLKELEFLGKLLGNVEKPYVAIVGGAKVSDKIEILDQLANRVQALLIGGAMANTFLAAQGRQLGKSRVETDKLPVARAFLKKAELTNLAVHLPTDVVVAPSLEATSGRVVPVTGLNDEDMALDIGPATAAAYAKVVADARTVLWNGPMGVFEKAPFAAGTLAVAKALAANRRALTVVGGGDSVAAVTQAGVADKVSHISTGGGASLELLEGKTLPGVAALE